MRSTPIVLALSFAVLDSVQAGTVSNIHPGARFGWNENAGWANWRDAVNATEGVVVRDTYLSGRIWLENVGWLSVGSSPATGASYQNTDASNYGVNVDAETGDLSGFGWGENIGWVNFDTSVLDVDRARFDRHAARFRGYVWAENIGWMNLDDTGHYVATTGADVIPATSTWGTVTLTLLLVIAGTIIHIRRCRPPPVCGDQVA